MSGPDQKSIEIERRPEIGLAAFKQLAFKWSLSEDVAAALLGISEETWSRLSSTVDSATLSLDQRARIACLLEISADLEHVAGTAANRWPSMPNDGDVFEGQSPIQAMIAGGLPAVLKVRAYVERVMSDLDSL